MKAQLSPREFKALYQDPLIQSVKLHRRQTGVNVPITFAEVVDVYHELVVYYYHEGFSTWQMVGIEV